MFQEFGRLMQGRVEPIGWEDARRAAALADRHSGAIARDLLHWAVMERVGSNRVVSTDRDFDGFPEVRRLDPLDLESWRREL